MSREKAQRSGGLMAVPGLRIIRGRERRQLSHYNAVVFAGVVARGRADELADELGLRGAERRSHRLCAMQSAQAFVHARRDRGFSLPHLHQLVLWRVERYFHQVAAHVAAARRSA